MNEEIGRAAADEFLSDAVANRMDQAEFQKKQLENKQRGLVSRLQILQNRIEYRQLENAADADHDTPLKKELRNANQNEMVSLSNELNEEWNKNGITVMELAKKLEGIEIRIKSLEAILPGNEEFS